MFRKHLFMYNYTEMDSRLGLGTENQFNFLSHMMFGSLTYFSTENRIKILRVSSNSLVIQRHNTASESVARNRQRPIPERMTLMSRFFCSESETSSTFDY